MTSEILLPRSIESHENYNLIKSFVENNQQPLWPGSTFSAVDASISKEFFEILRQAKVKNILSRGLEIIERKLETEKKGLEMADQKSGTSRTRRISRLLILSNDGAERFYRKAGALLRLHGDRVLAIKLDIDSAALGKQLFGEGKTAKMLLLDHKQSVTEALLAITRPNT